MTEAGGVVPDMRRVHGDATRERIMGAARALTAVHGLDGVTVGRLAAATELSKAGVFAHYGSKEALQLSVIEQARGEFDAEVIMPTLEQPPGLARLRAFVERYLDLVSADSTPGGCFFTSVGVEFEHRPGRIHDELVAIRSSWFEQAETEFRAAQAVGEVAAAANTEQLAFEFVVLLQGTNLAFQLSRDHRALDHGRNAIKALLKRAQDEG